MKKIKSLSMSLLLGLLAWSNLSYAELYNESKFIANEDIAFIENKLHELKNKDVKEYSKNFCVFSSNIVIKEELDNYCKEIMKESLDVLQFKIDLQKNKENISVPEVKTYKSLGILYGTFLFNMQKNPRYVNLLEDISERIYEKKLTEVEADTEVKKFIESEGIRATENEYKNYLKIAKELEEQIKTVEKEEILREQMIKNKYWMNDIRILTNQKYEKIFEKDFNRNKIIVLKKEIDKLLNKKTILDMYYTIIETGEINTILEKIQKKEMVTLTMEKCEFLRDFEVLSKNGLKTLTCIRR